MDTLRWDNGLVHTAMAQPTRLVPIEYSTDADVIAQYLEDAAHYPGGRAVAVARPRDVDEVASAVRGARRVLPVGARSSLTGGATPSGDLVLSSERLTDIHISGTRVVAGAGVPLQRLQEALRPFDLWLPPVPTFLGATVGGAVSTNAAGAATFKYGAVRDWVRALTIVLPCGDQLKLARGEVLASDDGVFTIRTTSRECRLEVPRLRMPNVPKRSAGYHAAPGMDLIDLFIGAEGTLGVIVDAELRVQPRAFGTCWLLVPLPSERQAIRLTGALRDHARRTWHTRDVHGIDVAAIEHIDRRSLDVLREDGVDRRLGIELPAGTDVVLIAQLELNAEAARRDLWRDLADARSPSAEDTPLTRICRVLDEYGVLDATEVALPSDSRRAAAFVELREAVPSGVNRRVAQARTVDARIHKTAADMIVPYDDFEPMMCECRSLAERAGLDLAVWGHISDGNVHPNVIPRSFEDVLRGRELILSLAERVIAAGGCPLAEHGVGRNPVKQELLLRLYGTAGVDAMRRLKLSLDPEGKLASGVLFPGP